VRRQQLDRTLRLEIAVAGAVHHAHAPPAERLQEVIRTDAARVWSIQCPYPPSLSAPMIVHVRRPIPGDNSPA
jgi:hypothetical protein